MKELSDNNIHDIFIQIMKLYFSRCHYHLEKAGIYPGQSALLCALVKKDGQSQKELCEKMKVKPATITVMIQRMEKRGLVFRRQDKEDKRVSRIFITEAGKNIFKDAIKARENIEAECLKNLTEEEKVILRRILLQIKENLMEVCVKEGNEKIEEMPMFMHNKEM